jgi:hypothetical protein
MAQLRLLQLEDFQHLHRRQNTTMPKSINYLNYEYMRCRSRPTLYISKLFQAPSRRRQQQAQVVLRQMLKLNSCRRSLTHDPYQVHPNGGEIFSQKPQSRIRRQEGRAG